MSDFILDMSLTNEIVYKGCEIESVGGRLNLITPVSEAVNIIGNNISAMDLSGNKIILTGAMAIWAHLVANNIVVHRFAEVWYDDGRGNTVKIAAHGKAL